MNSDLLKRKGARRIQDIPTTVLKLLNEGLIETVNLTEWLAVDHIQLVSNVFPSIGISNQEILFIKETIKTQKKSSSMNTIKLVGQQLYRLYADRNNLNFLFEKLATHPSDSLRCYAPYLIALNTQTTIEEKLNCSLSLIADKHFGVREVVWMALRTEIENDLTKAIDLMSHWAEHEDENIRRFTTEAIRPRGVWCKHIEALKEKPELALPILEKLKSDPSIYVQDSLANWLNDASKSQANFVRNLAEKWLKDSPSKETERIIKRALRTLNN